MSQLDEFVESEDLEVQCRQVRQEYLEDEEVLQIKEEIELDKAKRKIRIPKFVPEPQVTSQDPEERKLARRLRILRRKQYMSTRTEAPKEVKEIDVVQMQINKAYEKLFFIEKDAIKPVENIRLASEIRESRREKTEGTRSRKRRGDLNDEAQRSVSKFKELCDGWAFILTEKDNPLGLRDNLLEHRKKCQEFLDQKDAIIEKLKIELKVTNEKIDKDQLMSRNDLNAIGDKAMAQILVMKKAFDHHLELIQRVSDNHVTNEIRKLQNRVEDLRRLRNLKQLKYEKKITDLKIQFEQEMMVSRRETNEELNKLKNELERDQLDMEFVFSDVLGQCVVNAAKIYYNVEVLKGRVIENEYLITHQTHRLRSFSTEAKFLQDEINRLEKEMLNETQRVHKEARLLYRRIMDNQNRSQISTAANDKKYRDMWKLNRSNIKNLANRVLQTDRVIHEQYLGLDWTPALYIWTEMDEFNIMPSYNEAYKKFKTKLYGNKLSDIVCDTDISLEKPRGEREVPVFIPVWKTFEETSTHIDQEQQVIAQSSTQLTKKDQFLTSLMQHISDTSAFIVGQRLLDLIEAYDASAKDIVKLDALFRVLGAEKEELLPLLKECFMPYSACLTCLRRKADDKVGRDESRTFNAVEPEDIDDEDTEEESSCSVEDLEHQELQLGQEPESGEQVVPEDETEMKSVRFNVTEECLARKGVRKTSTEPFKVCAQPDKHPHTIKPIYVPLALNDFANTHTRLQTVTITPLEERIAQPGLTLSRALLSKEVATFWDKWCGVLPESREGIWDAFFIGLKRATFSQDCCPNCSTCGFGDMERYYQLLKDRSQLNRKLNILRKQNEDLKHLLQNNCKESKHSIQDKSLLKADSQIEEDDLLPKLHQPAIKLTALQPGKSKQPKLPSIHETEATYHVRRINTSPQLSK